MRYHHKYPSIFLAKSGSIYTCNHQVYSSCTLYLIGNRGLAVIQQRFDAISKTTFWTEIDAELVDAIYCNDRFKEYFDTKAATPTDDIYPTVTVRQIMWALRMKPIKRELWETYFDRSSI